MSRGLTLVELVITISLAGILGVPVGMLLSEQLNGALKARDYTVGMNLARQEMERLDSLNDFFVLASRSASAVPGFPAYTRTVTVTCSFGNCTSAGVGSQGGKRVEVVVTKTGSSDPLARLVTYRTKHVQFGT